MTTEDAPTPTPTPPGATGSTGGDLTALQAAIDAAARDAASKAELAIAQARGFDTVEAFNKHLDERAAADEAAKSDEQKRADKLAAAQAAVEQREAAAAALIQRGVINTALLRAGVNPDQVDKIAPLVQITGDVTDETAQTAVEALKADATFAPLFTGTEPGGPPSGVTGTPPAKGTGMSPQTEDDLVKQLLDERHPIQTA